MPWKGIPKKTPVFFKLKNIPALRSKDREGKIMENIDFEYLSSWASFMGDPVYCEFFLLNTLPFF